MSDDWTNTSFTPGMILSRRFFEEVVQPLLQNRFPRLEYAAALIGPGSEVLGFDTPISTDHHWGPRVMLFLAESDHHEWQHEIDEVLKSELPYSFLGYPTNFGPPDEIGVRLLQPVDSGPVAHRVEVSTVSAWFASYLGWDTVDPPTIKQWLSSPQHRLRAATTGAVFQDVQGELTQARARLAWYPDELWRYLLAAQWNRIAEEEAFMARCGDVGDDLGSKVIAARLAKDIMRLSFLMERQYAPYAKWFGSAFRQLRIACELGQILTAAIDGATWQERQQALSTAFERVAVLHNELDITDPLEPRVRQFHGRPYLVIGADRFVAAIEARLKDPEVRNLPRNLGSLDQVLDSTDKLEDADLRDRLGRSYA